MGTLGLIDARIDIDTLLPFELQMAVNGTHIKLSNEPTYAAAVVAILKCLNITTTCRASTDQLDSPLTGNNECFLLTLRRAVMHRKHVSTMEAR
jgi:hypothetical protein